jgi:hypothetical protein
MDAKTEAKLRKLAQTIVAKSGALPMKAGPEELAEDGLELANAVIEATAPERPMVKPVGKVSNPNLKNSPYKTVSGREHKKK